MFADFFPRRVGSSRLCHALAEGITPHRMDVLQLQRWLGLPAGPWPPKPNALLGLADDDNPAPSRLEQHALGRMELLRPHQLLHPELVTEGMNRLADAVLLLQQKVSEHRLPPVVVSAIPLATLAAPLVLLQEERAVAVPVGLVRLPKQQRAIYRELVHLRRLRGAWLALAPSFGDPLDPLRSTGVLFAMYESRDRIIEACSTHPAMGLILHPEGYLTLAVLRTLTPSTVLREMQPDQRQRVSRSWQTTMAKILTCEDALRKQVGRTSPRRRMPYHWASFRRSFLATPEWILLALGGAAVVVWVVRTLKR